MVQEYTKVIEIGKILWWHASGHPENKRHKHPLLMLNLLMMYWLQVFLSHITETILSTPNSQSGC